MSDELERKQEAVVFYFKASSLLFPGGKPKENVKKLSLYAG
jgi:hypothetical protein